MGTADDGKYFIKVYQVLYNMFLVMGETEYELMTNEPIKIAMMMPKLDDESPFYDSIMGNRMTFEEVLKVLQWKYEDGYVAHY